MVRAAALILVLALVFPTGALADADGCAAAVHEYNSSLEDVSSALQQYAQCINESRGKDDCSNQFSHLKSTQSDFEDAVEKIHQECDG